jgi:hypothetical protein
LNVPGDATNEHADSFRLLRLGALGWLLTLTIILATLGGRVFLRDKDTVNTRLTQGRWNRLTSSSSSDDSSDEPSLEPSLLSALAAGFYRFKHVRVASLRQQRETHILFLIITIIRVVAII